MTTDPPMSGDDIRAAFLEFFEVRGHQVVPSSSLIPAGDPTLLLTSAGMVPFKRYFTGEETPSNPRLVSVQKCFRTTDIEVVGDKTHLTFFEMLGNFSVGDYFKRDAIGWGWEFLTRRLGIAPERLWVTIYLDDDEAHDIWHNEVGVPVERIVRLGDADNFWGPAGTEGPCGPSSEIHYDYGEHLAPGTKVGDERADDRFVEIWNLVFVQFYQDAQGGRTLLPAPSIDTGMGLERITPVMQNTSSAYDTNLLAPVVRAVERVSGRAYGQDEATDFAIRVVTEHVRAGVFLIADGVVPSNEGRGYVLRRVIRRGVRFGRSLGLEQAFMRPIAETVIEHMSASYPELQERHSFVLRALEQEEERFEQAIGQGLPLLERELIPLHRLQLSNTERSGAIAALSLRVSDEVREGLKEAAATSEGRDRLTREISGPEAFYLFDSFGFPLELTQEIAREHGLEVDIAGFGHEMEAQRERGRAAGGKFAGGREAQRRYEALGAAPTAFLGYETLASDTTVAGMLKDGEPVQSAAAGDEVELVLAATPFYAEGGGQAGDTGEVTVPGLRVEISDTRRPVPDLIVHHSRIVEGTLGVGDTVRASVDAERRTDVMRNHTATHMLHAALRSVLGTHVRQAGSLVAPDRLRFDFSHVSAVTGDEISAIQDKVNDAIRRDLACAKSEGPYHDVTADGALAFFGDRYPERVRTLRIGDGAERFSYEVCGGTHLDRTGQIGYFRIVSESGLGTGVRRIEAVTGRGADIWVTEQVGLLAEVAAKLNAPAPDALRRVDALLAEVDNARTLSARVERSTLFEELEKGIQQVDALFPLKNGTAIILEVKATATIEGLREAADYLRAQFGTAVIALGTSAGETPHVLTVVTSDLVAKGFDAREIARLAAARMKGGAGGRPEMAQGGGKERDLLPSALEAVKDFVRQRATL